MTRTELSQFYHLNKMKKEAEQELERLMHERGVKALVYDDMPHAQGGSTSHTESVAIKIAEQIDVVRGILISCQQREKEIWGYIQKLENTDSYLAALVKYRCINRLRWDQIGAKLNTSADSCRMYYNRNIPKE